MGEGNADLARRWLEHVRNVRDGQEKLDIDLDDALMEFMLTDADPEGGWEIVVALLHLARTERDIRLIAAGPLDSLLREHGELLVDRVERMARTDSRLRDALRGIYPHGPIADLVARLPT